MGNALLQAKTIDLLQMMEKNLTQNSKTSSDSEYRFDEDSDDDLSQRSLIGKKHYNSKEIKQPLTPEKRFAIDRRLKKQQYHDATIAVELKLVNRYIAEKINDVRKCNSRRNLNMAYDIQNKNIPREEEKDFSENEPISNDMIN
ncbi:hypothetical protein Avbf_13266 [Armadillidium vulgare]|nr:hypothetical protein Avbf_13266 [Armadillidium vulgare]